MTIAPPHEFPIEEAAAEAREDLAANADARKALRREIDKSELRLAVRDLTEGLRGAIRVAPLVSVAAAVALGVAWGRRGRPRAVRRP